MKTRIHTYILVFFAGVVSGYGDAVLPDNYLPIVFKERDGKLAGECEYLDGFTFSMNVPTDYLDNIFKKDNLFDMVREQEITGTLTYPNAKSTEIVYEIVNYRGFEDIYMKTTLGYFLWEMLDIQDNEIFCAINWWYCPPARKVDLEALEMVKKLLADSSHWHKTDDRKCDDDIENGVWSLFCAIKYASIEKMGEYNHHNTAMYALRSAIGDVIPDHTFEHPLMDFNNLPSTTHQDILTVIEKAKKRIEEELGIIKQ